MSLLSKLSAPIILLALAGCATIFSSGPTDLNFNSEPEGAQVLVNNEPLGTTPVMLELHANKKYVITFRKDGCKDATVQLDTHVQAGFVILDIFAPLGLIIDLVTGEWKEFNDDTPFVTLDCD